MHRRNFLGSLIGGVAATAAVRTWPFRVFSFPTEISVEKPLLIYVAGIPELSELSTPLLSSVSWDRVDFLDLSKWGVNYRMNSVLADWPSLPLLYLPS